MIRKHSLTVILVLMLVIVISITIPISSPAAAQTGTYLHTSGNRIVNSSNQVVAFSGVNWFGFETNNYVPHGLWTRNWEDMLDQIADLGYNSIRLPFSNEVLHITAPVQGIDYRNPEFTGLTPIQVMDRIIEGAGARGLKIILDNHRSDAGASAQANGLWYTSAYPESQWIADWQMLTRRYLNSRAVVAMDLRNEPHATACWGCGNPALDWRLAAEKAGNAILSINPNLLILVEGNECYGPGGITDPWHGADCTWWGGNLLGARTYPVRLNVANRLVYSPHDYPASVYPQPWFSDPNYPNNLPGIWDKYWGYLYNNGTAPILIGEFGTRYATTSDQQWLQAIRNYIRGKGLSWTFWSLNPNSGDTGGLLLDDWITVDQAKQSILATIQYPFIDQPGPTLPPPTTTVPPTTPPPTTPPPTTPPPTTPPPTTTVPPTTPPPTTPPPTTPPPTTTVPGSCVVNYVVQNAWGSGATINVTIQNNGTSAINGWTLTWTFPGNQQISNLWCGSFTQSGALVSVSSLSWNAVIGANGGTASFGFNLAYSGLNTAPTSFSLNGAPCQSR